MRLVKYSLIVLALSLGGLSAGHAAMDDKSPIKVTSTGAGAKGFFKAIVEALHGIYRDAYPGSSATFKPSGVAGGIAAVANGKGDIAMAIPPVELQHALAGEPRSGRRSRARSFT